ncbi:amino acid adenylation domain-containing protein [Streptomyces sp. NPDC014734]|uniref:non-ribosomal peptide synthetase n=1 Tax=Streptomyces sp. NPDC014734 TaxID=3364886 RepID=UPI0036FE9B42
MSAAQERLWVLERLAPGGSLSHVPLLVRLTGELRREALESALRAAASGQAAFAARFGTVDGRLVRTETRDANTEDTWVLARHDLSELDRDERVRRREELTAQALAEPFDLACGPPARGCLMRTGRREHYLLLVFHRLAIDTASADIFWRRALALLGGSSGPTGQVRGVRGWPERAATASDAARPTPGAPPGPAAPMAELPVDRPRPARRDWRAGSVPFVVPAATAGGLRGLAAGDGADLGTVMLALYAVLLCRYGDRPGPRVSVLSPGRDSPATARELGCFETSVAVRIEVDEESSFRELVRQVRRDVTSALEREDSSPGRAAGDSGPAAFVDPAFSFGSAWYPEGPAGLRCEAVPATGDRILEDLALRLLDSGGELSGHLAFATDVFDRSTADRAVEHLLRLAHSAAGDPDRQVRDLDLLTDEEVARAAALNDVVVDVPDMTFPQVFEAQAELTPDATAVRDEDLSLSYGELNELANQLSHLLVEHGVGPEKTVGLCMDRSAQLAVAVLGVLKAGGTYVPVDPGDPPSRRGAILDDADVGVVLTRGPGVPSSRDDGRRVIELDSEWAVLRERPARNPAAGRQDVSHAAYLLYTSGSTGRPKGVVIEHGQLMSYTYGVISRFGIEEPLSFAMVQPLTVDSSVTAFFPPLCTGGEVHMITRERALDAERLAEWTRRRPVDCLKIAPSHLRALQASPRFTALLPRRLLVVGGEASDWAWLRGLQRMVPHCRVFNHYGPTETTVGVLTLAVAEHMDSEWTTAPIGVPLPNTQAHVVDRAGRPAPVGVAGELLIGGAHLARGYHRRDDLTTASFVPDTLGRRAGARLYRTGDIVRRLPDGLIEFLGRRDDQIKVRGFRVSLGEIDAALMSSGQVRQVATVVREDVPGDRRIVAYVEPRDGEAFSADALGRHIRERLSPHMVPQAVVRLAQFPLSEHGKVNRRALPRPAGPAPSASPPVPMNELERQVSDVWREILHVDEVGAEQSFFDVGGHSLLLVELQFRLRRAVGREIDLLDLFEYATVRAQAEYFSKREQPTAPHIGKAGGPQHNALLKRRQRQLRAKRGQHE